MRFKVQGVFTHLHMFESISNRISTHSNRLFRDQEKSKINSAIDLTKYTQNTNRKWHSIALLFWSTEWLWQIHIFACVTSTLLSKSTISWQFHSKSSLERMEICSLNIEYGSDEFTTNTAHIGLFCVTMRTGVCQCLYIVLIHCSENSVNGVGFFAIYDMW